MFAVYVIGLCCFYLKVFHRVFSKELKYSCSEQFMPSNSRFFHGPCEVLVLCLIIYKWHKVLI